MSEELDVELIKKTQSAFSKLIKEPPLTEKLLKKPPFRFLQDIIKSIVKETGYLRNVFTDEELLENAKDKEKKITFLKKVIVDVQETTGSSVTAKVSKIVAGLEVSKTLELLQLLAAAATLHRAGAVKPVAPKPNDSVKSSAVPHNGSPSSKTDKTKKPRAKTDSVTSDGTPSSGDKERKKKLGDSKIEKKPKSRESDKVKEIKPSKPSSDEVKTTRERPASRRKSIQEPGPELTTAHESLTVENNSKNAVANGSIPSGEDASQPEAMAVMEGVEIRSGEKPEADQRKTSARRSSSKTRPPSSKMREKNPSVKAPPKENPAPPPILGTDDVPVAVPKFERPKTARKAPPSARPASSRTPGVPKMKDRGEVKLDLSQNETEAKPVAVIAESDPAQDEENLVVIEPQPLSLDLIGQDLNQAELIVENGDVSEGALVAQILETKKELDENKQIWSTIGGGKGTSGQKVEIDWEGGRKQKKEAWAKEMNRLRDGIQQLTRSANPLGKLFDFLQEDVDSMQRELKSWSQANANYRRQLEGERRLTDESLDSYRRKLAELDNLIEEEQEAVRTVRASVLANDKRLMSLVSRLD